MAKHPNSIVLRADADIGNRSAEADDLFLFECFVDHPSYSVLHDIDSPKSIASGRTGSGKTAILRMIEAKDQHTTTLDLIEMSMDYVSNSDILRFLTTIGVDLDIFFQTLWKHVLCIEYIRIKYTIKNEKESKSLFHRIRDIFGVDERKSRAIEYLGNWESKFWITMDENIKEITSSVESKLGAEFSAEMESIKLGLSGGVSVSDEKKSEIIARAKKIVNSAQLADLNQVMNLLMEYEQNSAQIRYYILVDKLDEKWVDESIRFRLIKALIEVVKSFRKIRDCKVVVALRSDVLERAIRETGFVGEQRDKFDDYFQKIRWSDSLIEELIKKRITFLFRKKYTSENVHFEDIFPHKIGGKSAMNYIIERTLLRPRDAISFVNICLQQSQGETEVRPNDIRRAETEYSQICLQSLEQEWRSAFPSLGRTFPLLSKRRARFEIAEISAKEVIDELVMSIATVENTKYDPLWKAADEYSRQGTIASCLFVAKVWLSILYRIGAIGLKLDVTKPYYYSYLNNVTISPELIPIDGKVHIHPMLHRALSINEQ